MSAQFDFLSLVDELQVSLIEGHLDFVDQFVLAHTSHKYFALLRGIIEKKLEAMKYSALLLEFAGVVGKRGNSSLFEWFANRKEDFDVEICFLSAVSYGQFLFLKTNFRYYNSPIFNIISTLQVKALIGAEEKDVPIKEERLSESLGRSGNWEFIESFKTLANISIKIDRNFIAGVILGADPEFLDKLRHYMNPEVFFPLVLRLAIQHARFPVIHYLVTKKLITFQNRKGRLFFSFFFDDAKTTTLVDQFETSRTATENVPKIFEFFEKDFGFRLHKCKDMMLKAVECSDLMTVSYLEHRFQVLKELSATALRDVVFHGGLTMDMVHFLNDVRGDLNFLI